MEEKLDRYGCEKDCKAELIRVIKTIHLSTGYGVERIKVGNRIIGELYIKADGMLHPDSWIQKENELNKKCLACGKPQFISESEDGSIIRTCCYPMQQQTPGEMEVSNRIKDK